MRLSEKEISKIPLTDRIKHADKVWNTIKGFNTRQMTVCTPVPVHQNRYYDYFSSTVEASHMQPYHKPPGTWYAYGNCWVDLLRDQWKQFGLPWGLNRLYEYKYIYRIKPDYRHILKIKNTRDMMQFTKRFGHLASSRKWYEVDRINWWKASHFYTGIDIRFRQKFADKVKWYEFWDCSSGVIWNANAIKAVKLLRKI